MSDEPRRPPITDPLPPPNPIMLPWDDDAAGGLEPPDSLGAFSYIGRALSPREFSAYLAGYDFGPIAPDYLVLHHTAIPTLAQWTAGEAGLSLAQIMGKRRTTGSWTLDGMRDQYIGKGWISGPHLFIDERWIWLFSEMRDFGVHAAWGIRIGSAATFTTRLGLRFSATTRSRPGRRRLHAWLALRSAPSALGYKPSRSPTCTQRAAPAGGKSVWIKTVGRCGTAYTLTSSPGVASPRTATTISQSVLARRSPRTTTWVSSVRATRACRRRSPQPWPRSPPIRRCSARRRGLRSNWSPTCRPNCRRPRSMCRMSARLSICTGNMHRPSGLTRMSRRCSVFSRPTRSARRGRRGRTGIRRELGVHAEGGLSFGSWDEAVQAHLGQLLALAQPDNALTPAAQAMTLRNPRNSALPAALRGTVQTIADLSTRWAPAADYAAGLLERAAAIQSWDRSSR